MEDVGSPCGLFFSALLLADLPNREEWETPAVSAETKSSELSGDVSGKDEKCISGGREFPGNASGAETGSDFGEEDPKKSSGVAGLSGT